MAWTTNPQERVALALSGLVPLAWIDLATKRCADPGNVNAAEMVPSEEERQVLLDVILMADSLALGQKSKQGNQLSSVAYALCYLACCPGGVKFLGTHYYLNGGRLAMEAVSAARPLT